MPTRRLSAIPTKWEKWKADPEQAIDDLCARIESGQRLTAIADDLGIAVQTLRPWIDADHSRSARAREARVKSAAAFDEIALRRIEQAGDKFELDKAREVAHHLRWRAAKIAPKEYGDKLDVTADIGVRGLSEDALKAEALKLAAKLGVALPGHATGSV